MKAVTLTLVVRYSLGMVTFHTDTCDKCKRRNPIAYRVEPDEAWKVVVLNRWKKLCPLCFDQLAEAAGVRYSFADVEALSWSDKPVPQKKYGRRR